MWEAARVVARAARRAVARVVARPAARAVARAVARVVVSSGVYTARRATGCPPPADAHLSAVYLRALPCKLVAVLWHGDGRPGHLMWIQVQQLVQADKSTPWGAVQRPGES